MDTATEEDKRQIWIEHEWELPGPVPDKRAGSDYGYVTNGEAFGCSREEFLAKIARRGIEGIDFVWTPETPHPVLPETAPLLVSAFRQKACREARNTIYWGAGFLIFGLIVALASHEKELLYRNILSVIGAVALISGLWQLHSIKNYSLADAQSAAGSARFADWIKSKGLTGYTIAIVSCIILTGVVQVIAGEKGSIQEAGLVKPAVWQGQWWRLFTCTLMHVNFTHFWMNSLALLEFARVTEQTLHRAFVPLIFLPSAICGSVFSLFLYPNTTSVGSSGGLMGLLGFLTVAAYLDREKYPPKFFKLLIEGIIFVAILGVVGFAFVDNAAHLGGILGGLVLGWIFLRRMSKGDQGIKRRLPLMGVISLVLIGLIALIAIRQMLR
jgi:membrane associated rhomboid family serine protease